MTPTKESKDLNRLYRVKAGDSFNARFNLLLYNRIRNDDRRSITNKELDDFKISENEDILKEYIGVYWQQLDVKMIVIEDKSIDDIYVAMKDWRAKQKNDIADLRDHYISNIFKEVFPFKDFEEFYDKERKCDYCNITPVQIGELISGGRLYKKHITRGWTLEIDRKEPNLEYTEDNCVWCCYWCNNAKTDEFKYEEFKKIGTVIETIWNERLNSES